MCVMQGNQVGARIRQGADVMMLSCDNLLPQVMQLIALSLQECGAATTYTIHAALLADVDFVTAL